jgi:hypothetical protein
MIRAEFTAAAALLGVWLAFAGALLALAVSRGRAARRTGPSLLLPAIRDALVDYLAGSNDLERLRRFAQQNRAQLADAILSFQSAVGGGARDRLSELTIELALLHDWCADARSRDAACRRAACARLAFVCAFEPCRRVAGEVMLRALDDPDADVRLFAASGLAHSEAALEVERVFALALSGSPLTRVVLTGALRRHAMTLCGRAVPEALASADSGRVLAVLDMALAWECALPLEDLAGVIEHRDREVRLRALRLAPVTALSAGGRSAIVRTLADDDAELRTAAAGAAARLKLADALPGLALSVRRGPAEPAEAAAAALAEMPPRGWTVLKELASNTDPATAATARGALTRARKAGPV